MSRVVGGIYSTQDIGWFSIDYNHKHIAITGERYNSGASYYLTKDPETTISFNFTGSAIRIYARTATTRGTAIPISIDGNLETYSQRYAIANHRLVYEKKGLLDREHSLLMEFDYTDVSLFRVEILEGEEVKPYSPITENVKHLIKSLDKIQVLVEDGWIDTKLSEPLTKLDFETFGMDNLSTISADRLKELAKPYSILSWIDNAEATKAILDYTYSRYEPKFLEITTDPFSPLEKLNQEDEFEVLTWTDNTELIPKLELTVPEYKPIDLVEKPEIIVLGDDGEIPKLHIKGFRDLRPFCESDNPKLLINTEQSTSPVIKTESIPQGQLILPIKDIHLRMLSNIHSFTVASMGDTNGIIRLIFSVNSGSSWQTLDTDTGEFKTLDNIEDLNEVKAEGMTIETFNSIGLRWNEVIKGMSVRFGYYLEIEEMDDVANVDKLEVIMDVLGGWEALVHEIDYDYEYDNEKIYIELYRDGSYKINYI